MLVVYVGWHICWAAFGQIPPSIFLALTGWPAPTTGGTRSLLAILDGDWRLALYHNCMTLPIVGMLSLTVGWVLVQLRHGLPISLPVPIVKAWIAILALAWIVKLLQELVVRYAG